MKSTGKKPTIVRTVFKMEPVSRKTKPSNLYGFKFSFDDETHYCISLSKKDIKKEGLEFLKIVANLDDEDMDNFILELECDKKGVYIDGVFFDYPEIEKIIFP